jgi:two-component system NtrC family sensor kinase
LATTTLPNSQLRCQVLQVSEELTLQKALKSPAEYIRNPEHLKIENGTVWVMEVVDQLPHISHTEADRPALIVILSKPTNSLYKAVCEVLRPEVILLPHEIGQINEVIETLQAQLLVRSKKKLAERSVTMRNKELQILAEDLERLVEERTLWIEASNREQKELIRTERLFVQFLIEMSLKSSQEEVLISFRDQFRRLQLAQEVFLVQGQNLIFLHKSEMQTFGLNETIWKTQDVESLSESVSRTLAKHLSRPVGRLLVFPLPQFENEVVSGLIIEKATAKALGDSEYSVIKKYTQALGISLQRVKLEESNRLSALRWEKVFDGAQDPVAIITEEFDVIRCNQAFEKRAAQKKCYQIWAQREQPCEACPLLLATDTSEVHQGEKLFEVTRSSLTQQSLSDSKVFLHRYVDVTEKRQAHIRFIQNEKLSSIGQIAEQMAHEIYNPLAGIIALVQILLMDPKHQGTTRQDLEEIQKAAVRAQKVIENLQDFVREESDLTLTNLDEIVDKTLPLLKMKWRSFRLNLDLKAQAGAIRVQPQLISQVIYNLIQNACQAMQPGQTLTIRTLIQGQFAQLVVEDEGMGIPESIQGSIFKPFFTTKALGEGTGLGLSLSKQIAERFQGRLFFKSKVGVGTQFFLELPLEQSH